MGPNINSIRVVRFSMIRKSRSDYEFFRLKETLQTQNLREFSILIALWNVAIAGLSDHPPNHFID
jgi:hypothetical protein